MRTSSTSDSFDSGSAGQGTAKSNTVTITVTRPIFDTSATNRLHDDPHRHEIVAGLLAANRVLISELNLIEVMTTNVAERRISLCLLLKQLTRGIVLLLTPTTLLQKLTLARPNGLSSPAITSEEATPEAWLALQHPEKFLDEDARQGFYKEKQDIQSRYRFASFLLSDQRSVSWLSEAEMMSLIFRETWNRVTEGLGLPCVTVRRVSVVKSV